MFAIYVFADQAPSLFATPLPDCSVRVTEHPSLGVRRLVASDDFARVTGWQLTGQPRSPLTSLGAEPGETLEIPAWIAQAARDVALALGRSGDHDADLLSQLYVIEAWQTYGLAAGPATWLRCRLGEHPASAEVIIYAGRRGQIQRHTLGWDMPVAGAREVLVLTTDPDTRMPGDSERAPVRYIAIPRPAGWASREDRALVTWFAVWNSSEGEGHVTSRRGPAWHPQTHPNGWTYQEVVGAHGTLIFESADADAEQRARDTLAAEEQRSAA